MNKLIFFPFGICFGYILIKSGVSNYDVIRDMFLLRSWHLYGVLSVAVVATFLFNLAIKYLGVNALLTKKPINMSVMKPSRNHLYGGLIGGIGWSITGACPGPALAQIGFGTMAGVFTMIGIFIGTFVYGVQNSN